ncbi:Aste57867_12664 [Aphanomyces stellatus]|uniref:Aste57867_12664 protein n=1 Tax=Aphanomyces stellatus TaxID=120398 RepID=A0A485KW65_9STRA|nr:hypothetical protein As57867_012618 [Aphanomyces stellatus]VFT89514.1 Aste57867_12664 [Aphanomyces stellatus]
MQPPSPALSGSLASRFLGHLGDLGVVGFFFDTAASQARDGALGFRVLAHTKRWYAETKSSTIRLNMGGKPLVITKDPRVYKQVLGASQKYFTNSHDFRKRMGYFIPQSMIVLEGDQWARVRKVATRAIAMQEIDHLPAYVVETMAKFMKTKDGTITMDPIEVFPLVGFDVFHKIMYKWDPDTVSKSPEGTALLEQARTCAKALGARQILPFEWLWRLPLPSNRRVDAARDALRQHTMDFIKSRSQTVDNTTSASLLDCMLVAAANGKLTQVELVGQIQTFFFGSFETTSHTISLLLNHLAEHSHVQDKLRAELQATFPGGKDTITTLEALDRCTYLTWVVHESMRLAPHAAVLPRTCIEPCSIHGLSFERGDEVLIHSANASRDPENYPGQTDLEQFRPDRFGQVSLNKTATMPFGFGSRICPGRKIAMGELKAICAYTVMGWHLSRPANVPFLLDLTVGLGMRKAHGMLIWTPMTQSDCSTLKY